MRNLPGIVFVAGSTLAGVLLACRPSGPSAAGVLALVSATSSSPTVASSAPAAEPEPKVEFIPLRKPDHWKMVAIPDPSKMGKTTPCPVNPRWRKSKFSILDMLPNKAEIVENYCKNEIPILFPICTGEQMSRAVRLDAIMKGSYGHSAPEWDEKGNDIYWSFRGYLRRNFQFGGSINTPVHWDIQLQSFDSSSGCSSVETQIEEEVFCFGSSDVSCCRSSLIDSDVEVLLEFGFSTPAQLCVIPGQKQKIQVQTFLRSVEDSAPKTQGNPK